MPVCFGCKQMVVDSTRCAKCKKFTCRKCLRYSENVDISDRFCPDCVENNNVTTAADEPAVTEIEPGDILQSVKSQWWRNKFFKSFAGKGVDKRKVYCRLCIAEGKFEKGLDYSGSTTNLKQHDEKYHDASSSSKSDGIPGFTNPHCGKKWSKQSVQWKNATKAIVKWLVKNSRPANLVNDSGFIELMGMLVPEYELPSARTITRYMEKLYDEKHEEAVQELSEIEWCAVVSDGGSSSNQISFQDNQVAFIDENMDLKVRILGVKENKGDHDAKVYRERVEEDLEEFSIPQSKVVQFVTDSENKMKAAFPKDRSGCLAHIIHKTCEEGMKNETAAEVMKKWRDITTHYNTSYKLKYLYIKLQEDAGLSVKRLQPDVCHRWGSMKASIESALPSDDDADRDQYFRVLNSTLITLSRESKKKDQKRKLKDLVLSQTDMNRLKAIHSLYKCLDVATTVLGMKSRPTGSLVLPIIETIKKKVLAPDHDESPLFIEEMKTAMMSDFIQRVSDNVNLRVMRNASALDPCEKKLKFMKDKPSRKLVHDRLLVELKQLHNDRVEVQNEEEIQEPDEKRKKFGIEYSDSSEEDETEYEAKDVASEWKMFLEEPECSYDVDPLLWWRERKGKYPTVVRLARKYLAIPATSVEAERCFSALGLILSKRRLAMTAEHASMQMFLKDKLQN